jgi:hypothetical protein
MRRIVLKFLVAALLLIFNIGFLSSQHKCGTTLETQAMMKASPQVLLPRNNRIYLPIRFHIVTNKQRQGIPSFARVLDQLIRINKDFETSNVQFYMAGNNFYNIIENDVLFENTGDNHSLVFSFKDPNAINVFVTKGLGREEGVLAYYMSGFDYIAMLNTELTSSNNTLSHELGHFFSLRHTFYGWEDDPYSAAKHGAQVTLNIAPSYGALVERVNKSNCTTASDQICDTPPDYGFGSSTCTFNLNVLDPNGEKVEPMKENQMSYFARCANFVFTAEQMNRMNNNIYSNGRNNIRNGYIPNATPITVLPTITGPAAVVNTYNNVLATWTAVAGATHYFIEITDGRTNFSQIVNTNSLRVTTLLPNTNYFIRVRAFNEGFTDTNTALLLFKTGNVLSSVDEKELVKFNLEVIPNPVTKGREILVNVTSRESSEAVVTLFDVQGRLHANRNINLLSGDQQISLSTDGLTPGVYVLKINSKEGYRSSKVSIIE